MEPALHQDVRHPLVVLALGAVLLVLLAAFPAVMQSGWLATHSFASVWCVLAWVVGYAALIFSDERRLWSPGAIFFVIFAFFHYGLAVMLLLGGQVDDVPWFLDSEVPKAFALVGLGGISLALGGIAPVLFRIVMRRKSVDSHHPPAAVPTRVQDGMFNYLMAQIGATIAIVCILGWIMMTLIATSGRLFGLSYGEFLIATESYPRPWLTFGIAIGVALSAIDVSQRAARIALGSFVVWALIALPIGIRGDVMFPAAGALAAQGWRLRHIPARYFFVGAVVMLSFASILREVRKEGISQVDWRWEVISPASALRELGQSLRPTYETVRWIEDGDRHLNGASFWSPFERGFLRLFPLQEREAEDEERQMTVLVFQRVGPIGFSPVAEAYYNFGTAGVGIVMGLIGMIVGGLGMAGSSFLGRALMLTTLIPLLIFVRNSFTQVPGQMVVGWALVLSIWLLATAIARRLGERAGAGIAGPESGPMSGADQNRPT
jgi:hypothetical protein